MSASLSTITIRSGKRWTAGWARMSAPRLLSPGSWSWTRSGTTASGSSPRAPVQSMPWLILKGLEFRGCGARLRQRSLFDRDVYGSCRAVDVDLSRWSCGGAVHGRSWTTSRAGFLVGCGHEAEGLDIAEPAGKRVLDQARRQRRRPAPATDPQKREHLRLRPRGQ